MCMFIAIRIIEVSYLEMKIKIYSLVESGVDLDLGYIENVLTDYDSQHIQ